MLGEKSVLSGQSVLAERLESLFKKYESYKL